MSNPPKCLECDRNPVTRCYGQTSKWLGPRVIDGANWRWFCGKRCQGLYRGWAAKKDGSTLKAAAANRQKALQRQVARLVAAVKPHMDEHGKVDAMQFVNVFIREVRRERNLAACRRYTRRVAS